MPEKTSEELGATEIVARDGYVLEHSSLNKIPLWVCEGVEASQLNGPAKRKDNFKTDPELKGPRATPQDYPHTGYDRGHQAPAGNQMLDQALNDQTFYMSNMAPQKPTMNRQVWRLLEDRTRNWALEFGRAYEFTGPIFYDPEEDNAATANGIIDIKTIGKNHVAVPTHFYKIIVVPQGESWKSIAFVVPNQDFKKPYIHEPYLTSVEWIEQHTGLNFMPDLSAAQRLKLETHTSAMWP